MTSGPFLVGDMNLVQSSVLQPQKTHCIFPSRSSQTDNDGTDHKSAYTERDGEPSEDDTGDSFYVPKVSGSFLMVEFA